MTISSKLHESCNSKCRLDASVCNGKQRYNKGNWRCECKEFVGKGNCDKGFIWNHSICDGECDKLCNVGEYLDYEICKCREKIVDKLVEECSKNLDGNQMIYNDTSCIIYIVLLAIFFMISISISNAFISFQK